MRLVSVFFIVMMPLTVGAQQQDRVQPNDFAYGMPLEVDGDGALYSFELPEQVCRYSTRADLGDIRIFNGFGEVVPHVLRPGIKTTAAEPKSVVLPFFPVVGEGVINGKDKHQIHVATNEQGAVIDFWQRGVDKEKASVDRYLIDASALTQPLEKLVLDWGETTENFLVPVALEYSDDLTTWKTMVSHASLASMEQGGYRLRQAEIKLQPVEAKYYRLSWPLGTKGIRLQALKGVILNEDDAVPRHWLELKLMDEEDGVYSFRIQGHYPFDQAKIRLPQENTVVMARLFSRDKAKKSEWQQRFQGLLYNLRLDGEQLSNDAIKLNTVDAADWRLEIETGGGGLGKGEPVLEMGWVPWRVVFAARGESPFTLAFASAGVEPIDANILPLLNSLQKTQHGEGFVKFAKAGSRYELGGAERLLLGPQPRPWKQWLLWATLLISVLIIALMARSLYKQMNSEKGSE